MDVSLQLWSVKTETANDYKSAVKKVGELGYKGVEFAGYGNLTADEMNTLLKESNLYSVGTHSSVDVFKNSFDEDLEFNKKIGSKYIICPYALFETRQDVDNIVNMLNSASEKAEKVGIKVGYHNHDQEFKKIDGEYILDLIAKNTNDNVILEVDVFWVAYAGLDPVEYIKKWGKKIELVHLKQIGDDKKNVDIADGHISIQEVKDAAKFAKYFIVEQEEFDKPVWDSITNNVNYLKGI